MNKHFEALELPKILERLAGFTACPDAREAALALSPKNEYETKLYNHLFSILELDNN